MRLLRSGSRSLLFVALCLLVGAATGGLASRAHAGAGVKRMAAVALPVPSAGDVSYAVARVRITRSSGLNSLAGLAGQQTIFASRIGGLMIRAQSASWRSLRASTHVYVVVSMVPGGSRSLRDIGLFILRRKMRGGSSRANVTFTVANARAEVGSFWVHGVDRRGYATVFAVRDILSTALANWSRYIRVLQLAHALAAAAHPFLLSPPPAAASTAARVRGPGPWTGGQHPDARVLAMYHLIMGSIGNASSYALVKKDPLVAGFISNELGNPTLAARWRAVVAQVPLIVPDQYAAAAQEEKRFVHVVPPKISHARVALEYQFNSSAELGTVDHGNIAAPMKLTVSITTGATGGTITELNGGSKAISCPTTCDESFPESYLRVIDLKATPAPGWVFAGFSEGCSANDQTLYICEVWLSSDTTVTASFVPAATQMLTVTPISEESGQSGSVTSSPAGINCPSACTAPFPAYTTVTLTATPNTNSYFDHWGSGCTLPYRPTCDVAMDQPRNVQAYFGYP